MFDRNGGTRIQAGFVKIGANMQIRASVGKLVAGNAAGMQMVLRCRAKES